MSARDAITYLQSSGLVPNVPLPTVGVNDANKLLVVNNTATGYVLSAGVPVDAGVNSVQPADNSIVVDPVDGTGDVTISVTPNLVLETLKVGDLIYPTAFAPDGYVMGFVNDQLGFIPGGGQTLEPGTNINFSGEDPEAINLNNVISDITSISTQALTITGQYSLPAAIGTDRQVLGINGGELAFINQDGGMLNAGTNINYDNNQVNLNTTVTGLLQVSAATVSVANQYDLPVARGTVGQVLKATANGLEFANENGGGVVNSVQGSTNISVNSTDPTAPIVSLADNVQVVSLAISGVNVPTLTAAANQVLTCTGVGPVTLAWADQAPGGGTVNSVQEGTNITVNATDPANPVVALANNVAVGGTLSVSGVNVPVTTAGLNQVLTCVGVSPTTLGWANPTSGGGISGVGVTDALENLTAVTADQQVTLTMSQQPTFGGMTLTADLDMSNVDINSVRTIEAANLIGNTLRITTLNGQDPSVSALFPALTANIEDSGKVLTMQTNGNPNETTLAWAAVGGGGAVESVTAGSANLTATPTTGQVLINLADSININSINAKVHVLSSSDGQTNISLPEPADGAPLPVSGTLIMSNGNGTTSFSNNINVVDVSTETFELRSNDGLVTCTFPTITTPPTGGDLLAANPQGNLEFTNTITVSAVSTSSLELRSVDGLVTCDFPVLTTQPTDGYLLAANALGNLTFVPPGGSGGGITSIQGSTNITVDATDPESPIISLNPNPEVNSLILKGTTSTDDCAFPVVTSQVPVYSTFTTNGSGNLQFTTAPTFTALNFAAPGTSVITSGTTTQFVANAGGGGQVVQFIGPGSATAISLDSTAGIIKTADYPVSGGISSGNHVQATGVIAQSLFVTAKQSTGGVYSYKFPEIIGTTGIPVNSIMAMQSTPDGNFSQDIAFTTVNTLLSTSGDVIAATAVGNQIPLALKTSNAKTANYILAVNSDGLSLEWIFNANTSSTTVYQITNNSGTNTAFNLYMTAYARPDGFRSMTIAGASTTGVDNHSPFVVQSQSITVPIELPFNLSSSCLVYLSGNNVAVADFSATYCPPATRLSVPLSAGGGGPLSPYISLGRQPISYSVSGTLAAVDAYCDMFLENGGLLITFTKYPQSGSVYGEFFTIPDSKYVQFGLPGYGDIYPGTFSAVYFAN